GKIDFHNEYRAEIAAKTDQSYSVKLMPLRDGVGFRDALLTIDSKDLRLKRFEITDLYGQTTAVILKNPKINTGIADAQFRYEPQEGVEVIESPVM
ncbi:outer-membrane lipoprotein carrier protein LolA, partial [bacterium]|nr:outer-membrane lipoprotein carrier protein LolA [bacterium]